MSLTKRAWHDEIERNALAADALRDAEYAEYERDVANAQLAEIFGRETRMSEAELTAAMADHRKALGLTYDTTPTEE